MTDLVQALRDELLAIESDIAEFEAEAAKLRTRQQRTLDKAEKVRALITLYADEAMSQPQPSLPSEPAPSSSSVESFRLADPVSEQVAATQSSGATFGSPILRRFGRGLPPGAG